jgi:photosystem II stability/assembly factor-like uncharacterized protein
MTRAASLAAVLLLATACSGGSHPQAAPTPTAPDTGSPTPAATTPGPTPSPTASASSTPAVVGPTGTAVPAGFVPASATFVSDRVGWVLGASPCPSGGGRCDVIARTRDGGATWRAIPSPKTTPDHLAQIRFANATDGYVTGDQLWATHDGGATWRVVPGVGDVQAIAAAGGRVWVNQAGVLRSAPATGGALVTERAPAGTSTFVLRGTEVVAGSATNNALFVGAHGAPFVKRTTPCATDARAVAAVAADRWLLVCAGDAGLGHEEKHAFTSADAGRTWKAAGAPPQVTGSDLYLTTAGDFVIDNQDVAVSRDGDRTWQTALSSDGGLSEGGFESAALGFAIGGFRGGTEQTMQVTHDAGRHWGTVAF